VKGAHRTLHGSVIGTVVAIAMAASLCLSLPDDAVAQADAGPRFEVRSYAIEGATLLAPARLAAVTEPFVGPDRDFATIQQALKAIEKAYADAGWTAVQVSLPEQTLRDGTVRIQVRELEFGQLAVEGAKFHGDENIRRSLPSLTPGQPPNVDAVARNLRSANDNPSKNTTLLLRTGKLDGTVDAVAKVNDTKPLRFTASLDSTGSPSTGILRAGITAQHANLFDRDHIGSATYLTSPEHLDRVSILGLGYRMPVYSRGDSAEFNFVRSDVDSGVVGTATGPFGISGSGLFYLGRYNFTLPKRGDWDQRLVLGLDWRIYENSIRFGSNPTNLGSDVTVRPASVGWVGRHRNAAHDAVFTATILRNIPGANDGDGDAIRRARVGATSYYTLLRLGASWTQPFASTWQWRVAANAQLTPDALVPGEQFGGGGMDSVRGFIEREIANDRGVRSSAEIYTPDLTSTRFDGLVTRALAFVDYATLARNRALPGEVRSETISSVGIGVRSNWRDRASLRLDWGFVVQPGGLQGRGDQRLQGMLLVFF
jgi:hemolysin activation/secretion protein